MASGLNSGESQRPSALVVARTRTSPSRISRTATPAAGLPWAVSRTWVVRPLMRFPYSPAGQSRSKPLELQLFGLLARLRDSKPAMRTDMPEDAYPRDLIGYGRKPPHADWP